MSFLIERMQMHLQARIDFFEAFVGLESKLITVYRNLLRFSNRLIFYPHYFSTLSSSISKALLGTVYKLS